MFQTHSTGCQSWFGAPLHGAWLAGIPSFAATSTTNPPPLTGLEKQSEPARRDAQRLIQTALPWVNCPRQSQYLFIFSGLTLPLPKEALNSTAFSWWSGTIASPSCPSIGKGRSCQGTEGKHRGAEEPCFPLMQTLSRSRFFSAEGQLGALPIARGVTKLSCTRTTFASVLQRSIALWMKQQGGRQRPLGADFNLHLNDACLSDGVLLSPGTSADLFRWVLQL